jgi:hypothetical protein
VPLPECGSRNINGRGTSNNAKWSVGSDIPSGTPLKVGDQVKLTATVYGFSSGSAPNDGPDPLIMDLTVLGPAGPGAPTTAKVIKGNQYAGDGFVGPVAPYGAYGYEFDSNSSPNGLVEPGDGAHVRMTVTVEAVGPGGISVPTLRVLGHDATPIAGDFECQIPIGLAWPVPSPKKPTSGPDGAVTDATYSAATVDDANGGAHGVLIDVLSNDDDPDVAGGPGDPAEVRIRDWQPASVQGGTVSCGTPQQKGTAAFGSMSVGPCSYTPPSDVDVTEDTFSYVIRSVTGLERSVAVPVQLRPNEPPVFGDPAVGAVSNTDTVFDLSDVAVDLDGDPFTCIPGVVSATGSVTGSVTVDPQCDALWEPDGPGSGTATFPVRVCDVHPTLVNGQMGSQGTRAAGYDDGAPDDLTAATSSRCSDGEVDISIAAGLIAPPLGNGDKDSLDSGFAADGIGAYTVEIPVLANDTDANGPDPSEPGWTGTLQVTDADGIIEKDGSPAGTATVVGDLVRFTPADGFRGPISFTYRVCEDPATQDPPYDEPDDPNTPVIEGLPYCGLGTVSLNVRGNDPPIAFDDDALTTSIVPITDLDVGSTDWDPNGDPVACTPAALVATPADLVASASIEADCTVDVTPVVGAEGVATLPYEVCDAHTLLVPLHPATPYGADGRAPGAVTSRCTSADVVVTIVEPDADDPGAFELDPGPTCVDDLVTTDEGEPVDAGVLANDSDVDLGGDPSPLVATQAGYDGFQGQSERGGTVTVSDDGQAVRYVPPPDSFGADFFQYSAQDTVGHGCSGTVQVNILPDAEDPGPGGDPDPGGDVDGDGLDDGGGGGGGLARTGSDTADLVALGAILLAVGGGLATLAGLSRRERRAAG